MVGVSVSVGRVAVRARARLERRAESQTNSSTTTGGEESGGPGTEREGKGGEETPPESSEIGFSLGETLAEERPGQCDVALEATPKLQDEESEAPESV